MYSTFNELHILAWLKLKFWRGEFPQWNKMYATSEVLSVVRLSDT